MGLSKQRSEVHTHYYPSIKIYNIYGPTETTVWVTIAIIKFKKYCNIATPHFTTTIRYGE